MGSSGGTGWNVLSGLIRKRVEESREKHNAAEATERQNEFDLIMEGVRAHAANGTLTDEMLQQAQAKMQKLVPKESHPLIDAFGKVISHVRDAKKRKLAEGGQKGSPAPGQGRQQVPAAGSQVTPAPGGGQTPTPVPVAQPGAPAPQQPPSQGAPASQPNVAIPPTPSQQAASLATAQVTADKIQGNYRKQIVEEYRNSVKGQRDLSARENEVLDLWAMGIPTTSATMGGSASQMHPVIVKGKKGERIPGMQSKIPPFEVYVPDGKGGFEQDDNPEIVGATDKPKQGWAKDRKGWFSFAVDPFTNQPIPGTEDRTQAPPANRLPTVTMDKYHWVDDSGAVHETPYKKVSGKDVPLVGEGIEDAAAIPPALKGPGVKTKSTSTGTGTPKPSPAKPKTTKSDVIGTKDTGLLTPQAEKVIMTTQPVLDQVDRLMADIDRLKLGDNNTPGYLFGSRLKYGIGMASPEGSLANDIAGLSLGSVVEATNALQGGSRSLMALKKALVHTPNPWRDSPKLLREKLSTIKERLNDIVTAANTYGHKRQPASVPPPVPKGMQKPKSIDQQADEILAK